MNYYPAPRKIYKTDKGCRESSYRSRQLLSSGWEIARAVDKMIREGCLGTNRSSLERSVKNRCPHTVTLHCYTAFALTLFLVQFFEKARVCAVLVRM